MRSIAVANFAIADDLSMSVEIEHKMNAEALDPARRDTLTALLGSAVSRFGNRPFLRRGCNGDEH